MTSAALVASGAVQINQFPSHSDITDEITALQLALRIPPIINDVVHGTFAPCPLDRLFGFQRVDTEVLRAELPLPEIALRLKNKF
jgi:diaminopimelate decarboxylase